MNVEISIIIPVYNVEKYLKQCLDSVYNLDLSNKEIVLINDGSVDDSLKILERYKELYPQKTILISQKNSGLSVARNTGIKSSNGKFLFFIDSDDFIDAEEFEIFLKKGINYNNDIFIGNFYYYFGQGKNQVKSKRHYSKHKLTGVTFIEEGLKNKCFDIVAWKNLYRKDFLIKNNLFFEEKLLHEDCLFTPKAFYLAESVQFSKNYFYFYRQTNNKSITKNKNKKNYIHMLYIIEKLLEFLKENKINNKYFNRIIITFYLIVVCEGKYKNNDIFLELIKLKKNLREKFKILLIFILSLKVKKINKKEIKI